MQRLGRSRVHIDETSQGVEVAATVAAAVRIRSEAILVMVVVVVVVVRLLQAAAIIVKCAAPQLWPSAW